jgi:hypothetical protein
MRAIVITMLLLTPLFAWGEDMDMPSSIQEVKRHHEANLLKLSGVVSVGIGLDQNGDQAIIVGLDAPNPKTEAQIPSPLEGYPVEVQIVGRIKAQ